MITIEEYAMISDEYGGSIEELNNLLDVIKHAPIENCTRTRQFCAQHCPPRMNQFLIEKTNNFYTDSSFSSEQVTEMLNLVRRSPNDEVRETIRPRLMTIGETIGETASAIILPAIIPSDISIECICKVCDETTNILILGCRHTICSECITKLHSHTCPICRADINVHLLKHF